MFGGNWMIMFNVFLSGDTYMLREEIKSLVPSSKTFTNKWRWVRPSKSWQLKIKNTFLTDDFKTMLEEFTKQHDLSLQINEVITSTLKSINDYASEEEYWEAFHKRNGRRYF
jgi:hypothetical protein